MNSLIFTGLAAICAAFSNLAFRKSSAGTTTTTTTTTNTSSSGYLFLFYLFSFFTSLVLSYDLVDTKFNFITLLLGAITGTLNVLLMFLTSKALSRGPAGLTFAFQNASAIFPALVLYLLLGRDYGFSCTMFQIVGMALVLTGLLIGAKDSSASQTQSPSKSTTSSSWIKYACLCFFVQICALTIMQGRCILFESSAFNGIFSSLIHPDAEDIWFMPGLFGAALLIQTFFFLKEKRMFSQTELKFGIVGGMANCGSTCLLLLATTYALTASEKGILFPFFAISTIILCNIWATWLYKEKFNYKSCAICSVGILVGSFSGI